MYEELYEIWKKEITSSELLKLPPDFYSKTAQYLKKISEESRMLDRKTMKMKLLKKEMKNIRKMVYEVILTRYNKLVAKLAKGEDISINFLTPEEKQIFSNIPSLKEAWFNLLDKILQGQEIKPEDKQKNRKAFRFLKDVPAIIGSDLKVYGPFKPEDVGSLPVENSKILVKKGLAEKINI